MISEKYKSDLIGRAFRFGIDIIRTCETLPNSKATSVISNQIIRSATSVGANLVESKASSTRLEFKKFNEIALKSANETKYWLEMMTELKLINSSTSATLLQEITELSSMLASGIKKLKVRI